MTEKVKADRKVPAKQLTVEQIKQTIAYAFEGKAPGEIATLLGEGVERNQTYRVISTFKKRCQAVVDDDSASADLKAKAQAHLDHIPAREFGATAGGRTSVMKTTIDAMLDEL